MSQFSDQSVRNKITDPRSHSLDSLSVFFSISSISGLLTFHGKYVPFEMGPMKRLVVLVALCNGVAAQTFSSVLTEAPQCAVSYTITTQLDTGLLVVD